MKMIVKFEYVLWFRKTFMCDKKQCWKPEKVARAECSELSCGKGFVRNPHRRAQVLPLELLNSEFKKSVEELSELLNDTSACGT